jgi:hypothetical protein
LAKHLTEPLLPFGIKGEKRVIENERQAYITRQKICYSEPESKIQLVTRALAELCDVYPTGTSRHLYSELLVKRHFSSAG